MGNTFFDTQIHRDFTGPGMNINLSDKSATLSLCHRPKIYGPWLPKILPEMLRVGGHIKKQYSFRAIKCQFGLLKARDLGMKNTPR